MTPNDSIEVAAASIDEAVRQALVELGAAQDDVEIEILSTARLGVLGLGARPARVRVKRRAQEAARSQAQSPPPAPHPHRLAPAPTPAVQAAPAAPAAKQGADETEAGGAERRSAELDEQAREALALLTDTLRLMGETARASLAASNPDGIELEIKGDGSGILIGRHGQTLDALEYLVNRMLARRIREPAPVLVDTESYRARRRQQLERMALSMGERAKREHAPMVLQPMAPRDRRIIHLALKDDPLVSTRSSGSGHLRAVEILPVEGWRERGGREPQRPHERQREPEPVGQQGGFKRGQKRIV